MKISIEFDSSYEANLTIDGRIMRIISKPGMVKLMDLEGRDLEDTLGGIVATELFAKIADIQQAWAAADEEQLNVKSWDYLTEEAREAAIDRL